MEVHAFGFAGSLTQVASAGNLKLIDERQQIEKNGIEEMDKWAEACSSDGRLGAACFGVGLGARHCAVARVVQQRMGTLNGWPEAGARDDGKGIGCEGAAHGEAHPSSVEHEWKKMSLVKNGEEVEGWRGRHA